MMSADAARLRDEVDPWVLAQGFDDGQDRRQPLAEQGPPRLRGGLGRERREDPLLRLRAQAGEPAKPLLLRGGLELDERGHAELLPDPRGGLRA